MTEGNGDSTPAGGDRRPADGEAGADSRAKPQPVTANTGDIAGDSPDAGPRAARSVGLQVAMRSVGHPTPANQHPHRHLIEEI